ncbi:uncharacterized protein LOC112555819 [Pomacea canaliculata]|uniref:uncharacterized protein LOC112555819 n=1 Tax=Pomacea canaliculata TaxID=400727 RepID=UPI000D7301B2|nr:uncharacterized protein LOC112555819 [Pomacea canaliculata]
MACLLRCLGLEEEEEVKNNDVLIIDVQEVLSKAAWESFLVSKSWWKKRRIKKKDYIIEVPMNYYHFEEIARDFKIRKSNPLRPTEQGSSNGQKSAQKQPAIGSGLVGLKTMFNNNTEKEQKYNFNFEKTRHASVNITYQKGYSIGGKANFTLGLPKVDENGSVGAEVEAYVEVTKATGDTFEETVTTSATSEITVAANSHYTATVVMEERTLLADFKISIMMTMPQKKAPVYIKDIRTGELVLVRIISSLPFYFKKFEGVELLPPDEVTGKPRKDAVIFHIEGIVDGVQLSSHRINLQQDKAEVDRPEEPVTKHIQGNFLMEKSRNLFQSVCKSHPEREKL